MCKLVIIKIMSLLYVMYAMIVTLQLLGRHSQVEASRFHSSLTFSSSQSAHTPETLTMLLQHLNEIKHEDMPHCKLYELWKYLKIIIAFKQQQKPLEYWLLRNGK